MTRPYDPSFIQRLRPFAAQGMSRFEIGEQLGLSTADFDVWAAAHPPFAIALADADTIARAWWDAQPRKALTSREPFRAAAWAKAMQQRYGRTGHRKVEPKAPPRVEAIFDLPESGRRRRRPSD
ncbi:MAG TPA: hypothetical protein VGF50_13475 [Caulobacteraceae bacterium]